jgi:hypothetical protein
MVLIGSLAKSVFAPSDKVFRIRRIIRGGKSKTITELAKKSGPVPSGVHGVLINWLVSQNKYATWDYGVGE